MTTLCVVPCGKRKIWDVNPEAGPTEAKYVYVGSFSKKCREYAERFHQGNWCILSAKHGFLMPHDIVHENYDVSFTRKTGNPIGVPELVSQAREKRLNEFREVVVLGGKVYVSMLKEVFPMDEFYAPLSGCRGIGHMMHFLSEAMSAGIPS